MSRWARVVIALAVECLILSLFGTASGRAKPAPITGKLSKPGYTVIALAANGKARSVRAKHGKFRVKPPAAVVTLHLRATDGTYAGPIVVGGTAKRIILGVEAGADLGRISVRRGYAKVAHKLPEDSIDEKRWARARKGVPIGAGKFGRVRSRHARGGVPGDSDLDGIPDPLDIDDNGNLILDDHDISTAASASQASTELLFFSTPTEFHVFSRLTLYLPQTVNANAAASTDQQVDTALSSVGDLLITILPGDTAELDCGDPDTGLVYCRKNGSTGRAFGSDPASFPPFPACCDPDGDGFGTLNDPRLLIGPGGGVTLRHGATTAQIGTGDVLIQRVTTGGVESDFPSTQQYVFATVPALVSFSDSAGNSTTVSYPVAAPDPGTGMGGGPGSRENPYPVAAGPNGDVVLTLTYWRPQRTPIPGEPGYGVPGAWTDIGGLVYTAAIADTGFRCPQGTLSESDPNLASPPNTLPALSNNQGGFLDQALDQPANPGHTFTYTVNLTQCLAAKGLSFNPGEKHGFEVQGITPNFGGVTIQPVFFKRQ